MNLFKLLFGNCKIFTYSISTFLLKLLPAQPFENVDNFETSVDNVRATNFWHNPYAAKRMLFSATLAANDGTVPAYKPRTTPSFFNVSLSIRWKNQIILEMLRLFIRDGTWRSKILLIGILNKEMFIELLT